jgi:hypothetical protein
MKAKGGGEPTLQTEHFLKPYVLFYFFAAIVIWLGILSLRGGFRFASYVKAELAKPLAYYTPFATVIVPCRGNETGLDPNPHNEPKSIAPNQCPGRLCGFR